MEYMKHTNFYAMYNEIRKKEADELRLALKAHGGEFTWIDDNNIEQQIYSLSKFRRWSYGCCCT